MAKELNFKQELTGCFGQPVAENPTQPMVEAAYRYHQLNWRYLTIEVTSEGLADAVAGAKALGFRGFNCTIPHKVAVIEHLDSLGESAALMGAVNCVVIRDGKLIGENTDGKGFVAGLRTHTDPVGKRLVLFGAGGAARAIGVEMALAGASHLTIVNRDHDRGHALAELLDTKTAASADFVPWEGDYSIPSDTDIVVNATSIGLYPDLDARIALDTNSLTPSMIISDVIPNPPETRLIRDGRAKGCTVIDGLSMLVNQGIIGIEYWTGITPSAAVMREALEEIFG